MHGIGRRIIGRDRVGTRTIQVERGEGRRGAERGWSLRFDLIARSENGRFAQDRCGRRIELVCRPTAELSFAGDETFEEPMCRLVLGC